MSELDELRQEILKQSYVDTTVIRWSKLPDEPIEQKAQAIVEIPIDDLMDIIELFIANQVREAKIEAFDIAFDCHDYDRLRAYRAALKGDKQCLV